MAKIIDPDQLNQGTEVVISTAALTIDLAIAGNLSTDGVSMQALYSFLKEEWKSDAALIKFPFPMVAITPEQFEFVDGWYPADLDASNLFRDGGYAIKDGSISRAEFVGVITLGSLDSGDSVYYQQSITGDPSPIVLAGAVNQCVKSYDDGQEDGNWYNSESSETDFRDYFKVFARTWKKSYASADHQAIGVTTFTYQAYRFPLTNANDLKVTLNTEAEADVNNITVDYFATGQSRTIGAGSYDFSIIIDGNNKTTAEIYMGIQALLKDAVDINDSGDDGVKRGDVVDDLLYFVGDTLVTRNGVYIDNFQAVDTNAIQFYDDLETLREFPYVAAGTINFNQNLQDDNSAVYRMYYTTGFGTVGAELVENAGDIAISGVIAGASVSFDYDYDGDNADAGAGNDKNVTIVAIGENKAQYVVATGTIGKTNANNFSLVAALERNFI